MCSFHDSLSHFEKPSIWFFIQEQDNLLSLFGGYDLLLSNYDGRKMASKKEYGGSAYIGLVISLSPSHSLRPICAPKDLKFQVISKKPKLK